MSVVFTLALMLLCLSSLLTTLSSLCLHRYLLLLDGWVVLDHDMTTALLATTDPHPMAWTVPMTDAPCMTEDTTAALHRATTRDTTATKSPSSPQGPLHHRLNPRETHLHNLQHEDIFKTISKHRRVSFAHFHLDAQQPQQPPINFDFFACFSALLPRYYRQSLGNFATIQLPQQPGTVYNYLSPLCLAVSSMSYRLATIAIEPSM